MSEEKPISDKPEPAEAAMKVAPPAPERRRGSRSAFAPIVLIAAGVFFLLDNLGVVSNLNWDAALRFWPLALIFLGLNVLVVQLPRPVGTILSALVALAAVAVFGWLLLSGPPNDFLRSLGVAAPRELQAETFALTPGAAETAAITLNMGNYPARVEAGSADNVVSGTIWTSTGVDMKPSSEGDDRVEVTVGELPGTAYWTLKVAADGPAFWTTISELSVPSGSPATAMVVDSPIKPTIAMRVARIRR